MCVCVRSCVCWKGWLELLWKDSLGESMRAWGILKALLKTLAYAVVVGRNREGSVSVCSYSGNLTCMGLCPPASCFLSLSLIKASLAPGRRLGELPSLTAPYTPYGGICSGTVSGGLPTFVCAGPSDSSLLGPASRSRP